MLYRIQQRSAGVAPGPSGPCCGRPTTTTPSGDYDLAQDAYDFYAKQYPRSERRAAGEAAGRLQPPWPGSGGRGSTPRRCSTPGPSWPTSPSPTPPWRREENVPGILAKIDDELAITAVRLTADFYRRTGATDGAVYMYRYQLLTYPERPARAAEARAALAEMPAWALAKEPPRAGQPYVPPATPLQRGAHAMKTWPAGPTFCWCLPLLAVWVRVPGRRRRRPRRQAPVTSGTRCTAQDVQTVAVPVFVNRTFRRGLESDLTTSVIQQLEEHSPYKVVPTGRADTVLEGVITDADLTTLSTDVYSGLPQEQSYNIVVSFLWKNLRTGQVYAQRRNFDQHTSFFPTLGESVELGSKDAVQRLAVGIVQEMQADW